MRKFVPILLFLFSVTSLYAQDRTLTGTVYAAEDNSVLPGVNVTIKGTGTGVSTDANGAYSISIPAAGATLSYSFIGRVTQEVAVTDQATLDVKLAATEKKLEEVIVTANAVERKKRELGYATTEFNNQDITQGRDRSVVNSMQGKVAGVDIISASGSPGASTRFVIRGNNSLLGNNQALFVVDGIIIDNTQFGTGDNLNNQVDAGNPVNNLSPEDIQSVVVLKGPAAAALYGTRGANGAVIITTKNGRNTNNTGSKKMEVSYTASYSFENLLRLPKFQHDFGQGHDVGSGDQPFYAHILNENFSWGPRFDGRLYPWGRPVDGVQQVKPYNDIKNNVRDFFDIGHTFQQSVSLGGSDDRSNYFFSFGQLNQKGVMPTTGYDRYNVKVAGGTKLSNKFYTSGSVNYIKTQGDLSVQGQKSSAYDQVLQTPRDISLQDVKDYNSKFNDLNNYYTPYNLNPWYLLNKNKFRNNVDRILGNAQLGVKLLEGLDVVERITLDQYSDQRTQYTNKRIVDPASENSQFDSPNPGFLEETRINVRELNSDLMATYNTAFGKDFSFRILGGWNIRNTEQNYVISTANALIQPDVFNFNNIAGNAQVATNVNVVRSVGYYADASVGFRDFLYLGLTGRYDKYSTLPTNKNGFFYPSANISFLFTDAFKSVFSENIFTSGKLRANVAQVGSSPFAYYLYNTYTKPTVSDGHANTDLTFPFNGVSGYTSSDRINNANLKPEQTRALELGLDMSIVQNRIGFEFSYYAKSTTNQIVPTSIAPSSGYTSRVVNIGEMTNKGIEVLIRVTPIKTEDFEWTLSANYTRNRNKVVKLLPGVDQLNIGGTGQTGLVAQVGQPFGSFLTSVPTVSPTGATVVDSASGLPFKAAQSAIAGNIQPDWIGGLTTTFRYKGLVLSATFNTRQGGQFYSRTKDLQEFIGTSPNTTYNNRQAFVVPGSVIQKGDGSYVPNTTKVNPENYWIDQTIESYNIISASYVKLREVSLSYSIPKGLLDKTFLGSLTVGISGRNLYLWTPKSNTYVDPEISSFGNGNVQGYDFGAIPSVRSVNGNIRFTF